MNAVQEGGDKEAKKKTEVEQALMKKLRKLKVKVAVVKERVRASSQAQNYPTQQPIRRWMALQTLLQVWD